MAFVNLLRLSTALVLGLSGSGLAAETGLEVGRTFPEIALPALEDGSRGSVSQWRGKRLMLHIFASW